MTTESEVTRIQRLLLHGPTLILVAVGVFQIGLSTAGTLSPWKGGGFGMFSSLEGTTTRRFHYVATNDKGEEFSIIAGLGPVEQEALIHPTPGSLRRLATSLEKLKHPPGFVQLRIDLWKTNIEGVRATTLKWLSHTHQMSE